MDRRTFLKLSGGAAFAGMGGVGCATGATAPGVFRAGPWADVAARHQEWLLPTEKQPEGMLEVFLVGGLSPWESFYTVPTFCDPAQGGPYSGQQWWTYQEQVQGQPSVSEWFSECGGGAGRSLYEPYGIDAAGLNINLGPFILPLRDRPDLLARMRVWVVRHDVAPHEVAIPLAMSGHRLGSPRQAALGSHFQRFFGDRAPADRAAPYAYALYMSSMNLASNGKAAWATGLHRASARPLAIGLGAAAREPARLQRQALGAYRAQHDALVQHYLAQYQSRLHNAAAQSLRAPGLHDYEHIRHALEKHQALTALLPPDAFEADRIPLCVDLPESPDGKAPDEVKAGLRIARELLTAPTDRARYVQLLDSGVWEGLEGLGYDSHEQHVMRGGTNLSHLCQQLADSINRPGENNSRKLDLDRHFVLLNTEFGRGPVPEHSPNNPDGTGTDHWPYGYVIVGFGGFVDEDRAGILGAIGEDSYAIESVTPAEHRAAMLLAMGAWPFARESFAIGDVRDASTEEEAATFLREHVLGYKL